jgi:hypothetical protein
MLNSFAHNGVDAIQGAKKQFVSTFVQHEQFKSILTNFIDAQSAYTKAAIDSGISLTTRTVEVLTDRTPYVKMTEKFSEFFPAAKSDKKAK